ncbi:hypothetical protein J3D43_004915 [Paenibacillus xylanexedens]|uniref:hypothetical protein n=1 Tax=Paenibacillus xylanexedens TaxID=528191 RepID=UPI00209E2720|nr:hypothetical protein [Paenibacillus xylanexedens]MCP1426399.1 hypothetical protein [Paenibacillus xylanexedens]
MDVVSEVFTQIGQTAVIVGGAGWLTKSIFSSWHNKNVESHKSELNKSVEQYKYEIQRELQLHQIRNIKLHNDRAEVIKIMYSHLVKMEHWLVQTFWPKEYIGPLNLEDRAKEAYKAVGEFLRFYQLNKIFFGNSTCESIDMLIKESLRIIEAMRDSLIDGTEDSQVRQKDVWHDAWNSINASIPHLKEELENDFRQLMGVL